MTIISWLLTNVAEPQQESPPDRTRRRWLVVAVLVVGAALLAVSLTRRPGEAGFYWSTLALAAVWAGGAVLSGPLHRGTDRRGRPPVLLGVTTGLLTGALFALALGCLAASDARLGRRPRWLVAPQELPVGVLTAVLGGGYLLWLMHRRGLRLGGAG